MTPSRPPAPTPSAAPPTARAAGVSWRRRLRWLLWLPLLAAVVALGLLAHELRGSGRSQDGPAMTEAPPPDAAAVERGAYLARAGNCAGCHTVPGGAPMAGGRGIETPFGTVMAGNLTPHPEHGIGRWSADDFWRALHEGRAPDGRLLVPAFPYPSYTQVTRADADDLYAWLRSLPPVAQPNRGHALRFPYDSQLALAAWRLLYFEPGEFRPDPQRDAAWNRGSYLVRGLGHCVACHSRRNVLGASTGPVEFGGGPIPMQRWDAPSLASPDEAGVADWSDRDVLDLLKTGRSGRGWVTGPMAEVVFHSTQYLSEDDLLAMARFLKSLPQQPAAPRAPATPPGADTLGARLYADHCASCHGEQGQGSPGAVPPLAGSRTVTMASPVNLLRSILLGGFGPVTAGHPRPHGMPPYAAVLSDAEVAALATYLRASWGNAAPPVQAVDVFGAR